MAFARSTLDEIQPGHAPVLTIEIFRDPVMHQFGGFGDRSIIVLRMADDTVRAIYVQCGVGLDRELCFLVPPDEAPPPADGHAIWPAGVR